MASLKRVAWTVRSCGSSSSAATSHSGSGSPRRQSFAPRWTRQPRARSYLSFPGARIDVEDLYGAGERVLHARHKSYAAYQRITMTSRPATKMTVYGDLLRAMLADQLAFIDEPSHARVITEDNGRESLRMSVRARALATAS